MTGLGGGEFILKGGGVGSFTGTRDLSRMASYEFERPLTVSCKFWFLKRLRIKLNYLYIKIKRDLIINLKLIS